MRRRSTTQALSPKLLKHFAAAAVVLTTTLAVFASGADWGAQAQVEAVEAKNQLAQTEAEKLGTKRIATTLKVANRSAAAGFGDDDGGAGDFGGGGGGSYAPPAPRMAARPSSPGASAWAASAGPSGAPPLPGSSQPDPGKARPAPPKTPSPEDIAQITASSAQRSGASAGD